jgi:hypothetical protein
MQWETVFSFANLWAIPFWLLLALGPRTDVTTRIIMFGGVGLLALTYAILLPMMMTGLVDPVRPAGSTISDLTTLAGVMSFFDSKGGATVGWIHYLAFDMLTGLWVARNADRHGYARWVQFPILFFTFMLGPVGLVLYLLLRFTCKTPPENATAPN